MGVSESSGIFISHQVFIDRFKGPSEGSGEEKKFGPKKCLVKNSDKKKLAKKNFVEKILVKKIFRSKKF